MRHNYLLRDAYYVAKTMAQKSAMIKRQAYRVANDCQKSQDNIIRELGFYLQKRASESPFFATNNDGQILARTKFIAEFHALKKEHNIVGLRDLLKEDRILSFKGRWSQRLYDLLVTERTRLLESLDNTHGTILLARQ